MLVFVSSLVYVINFAMLPPRSEFMGSNRSKGNSRYQPIEEFENSDGNEGRHSNKPDKLVASEDLQDAHAIVVMERDMPYLKKWKPQDLKNKQLELLAKDLFSGNLDRFIKRYLNYLKPIKVYQLFCLETACILMEASYQAYFPVRLEDKKLPQSAKHPQNMRENHDIFKDVSETYIGKLGIASTRDLGNPFVDESETGDGATLNYGPQLDLDRLGISLLSTFQCGVYSVFGFLSYSDKYLLVSFRGSTSDNYYTDINLAQVPLPVLEMSLDYFAELLKNVLGTDNGAKSIGDSEVHVNVDAGISNDYGLGSLTNLHHLDESHELGDRVDKAPSSYSDTYEDELSSQLLLTPAADYYLEDMNDKISAADLDVGFSPPAMNTSVVSESDLYFGNSKSSNTMLEGRLNHDIEDGLTSHGLNRVDEQGSLSHAALKSSAPYKGSSPSGISGSMSHCCRTICTSIPILKQNFPRVHHGFLQSYLSIREQFIQSILQAIVRHRLEHARIRDGVRRRDLYSNNRKMPSELDLYFTGHSLGGAISVLAALDLAINIDTMIKAVVRSELSELSNNQQAEWMLKVKSWKRPTLTVYTFGSPRMGNAKFAQLVINKVDSIYRLVVDGDLITMLPSVPGFYRHVGTQVIIDDDGKGSIIINPSVIEHSILKRSTGSLANHSLEKYRFCLEACFDPSELNEYMAREYLTTTMAVNKNSSFGNKTRPEDIPEWLLMK